MILENLNKPNDIKNIDADDYKRLAVELRHFLVEKVSKTGGHLASNLGVVELTMALHIAFDFTKDKVIWDVGHQSYVHKILSGKKDEFDTLREYGGMSGFPKRRENECDCFDTGHSSTSISAGLGLALANQINGCNDKVVAVIGDGALSGGMALEALNNVSRLKGNYIIVLNDNNMSISENVGGISKHLSMMRVSESYNTLKDRVANDLSHVPVVGEKIVSGIRKTKSSIKQLLVQGMIFENMGIKYVGPVDGHNTEDLVSIFNEAKTLNEPVIIHVITQKGLGYPPAEDNPAKFHGIAPFDKATGEVLSCSGARSYTSVFSEALCQIAENNSKVVAITAAMPDGTGLDAFMKKYPDRCFDVGIAEQHAVTFAAGLAAGGLKPYVAIYSSFLQRAYDQIMEDVCIQDLPVTFCIDRAGIVGKDGETHHGIFDISYLLSMPNINIFAPKNGWELAEVVKFSENFNGPLAIRYPRGAASECLAEYNEPIQYGKSEIIYFEKDIAILALGSMVEPAVKVREVLKDKGYNVSLINARFVRPLDEEIIDRLAINHKLIVTLEENELSGGFGARVLQYVSEVGYNTEVLNIAIPNAFLAHGDVETLKQEAGIDKHNIINKIISRL